MIYSKIPLAQTVIQLCKKHGIRHVIISPGSRNAPLTIGFTHDSFFSCYSIVDERCAAFFALGMAQQLNEPTAVVCTSGSALLNYYPAVAEAFYSAVPLVVLSADRPEHLIGIGDGQTINQPKVFKNHILYSAVLKLDVNPHQSTPIKELQRVGDDVDGSREHPLSQQEQIQNYNETAINKALNVATLDQGPVHINIPFDEPLYDTIGQLSVAPKKTVVTRLENTIEVDTLEDCIDLWDKSIKKMILVGVNRPNSLEQKWLDILSKDPSVIVLTETTSNLHHEAIFPSIDQLIAPLSSDEQADLKPDILVTFGGLIVSKKIKALLRKHKPAQHWYIDPKNAQDTFFSLSKHIAVTPNQFFEAFLTQTKSDVQSDYQSKWLGIKEKRLERHEAYLKAIPFSDFLVFHHVLKTLPETIDLHVGNSSAIRYTQLFRIKKSINVFCNRGTSGIDGSTSTAIGSAVMSKRPTVMITGDLSFFYDSNALWNNYIPSRFRIILLNNNGGGIFRILPGHKNTENFDRFFETTHEFTAEHLCKMYNFGYQSAHNVDDLTKALSDFHKPQSRPQLLEIFTPRNLNDSILLDYFEYLK